MSDFLFSIGVDPAAADSAVQEFVRRTNSALDSIQKVQFASNAGAKQALTNQESLLKVAQQRLAVEEKIAAAQRSSASSGARAAGGGGFADISGVASGNATAIGKQKDALDFLNRIMGNTVFKFIEYELVMKAFNGAVGEVFNSLNEASNVQMEMVLQRIYSAQINTNAALKDSIIIAKQWGSDITDVQQAIGLWTKQTSQMHDATGKLVDSQTALAAAAKLAADAEKFHRASGIDSLEVYSKSVSMWHELGLSLGQIPALYDKIAFAATKISPVLKAQPGSTSKQEGIKDIFEGVSESGATLRAQGMDDATIIATVAQQIENLGTTGTRAGSQISTMFGSLNQGGKQLREWVKVLGGEGAFKDSDTFMAAAIQHINELKQAQADGLLHVRPQTMNTWRAFIETLEQVKKLADDIRGKSNGTLELISEAQMNTYSGQVDRLKASFQELNLALGTQLLPTATRFISFLSGTMLPVLAANSHAITGTAQAALLLGTAYIGLLGWNKAAAAMAAFRTELAATSAQETSAALVADQYGAAQLSTIPGMEAATAQMVREREALALLQKQIAVVSWETGGLAAACTSLGITETELAEITATRLPGAFATAGAALSGFAARAAAVAGPLLAIYAAMSALQNLDSKSRINAAVDGSIHESEGGAKGIFDSIGDTLKSPLLIPDGGSSTALGARIRANGGAPARQLNSAEWMAYNNPKATNDQKTDAGELIKQLLSDEYDKLHGGKDVKGYDKLDQISKELQGIMNRAMGGTPAGMTMPGPGTAGKTKGLATPQQIAAEETNKVKADAMAQISKWRDIENAAASYAKTLMEVGKAHGFTEDTVRKLTAAFKVENDAIYNGQSAAQKEIRSLEQRKIDLQKQISAHGGKINEVTGNVTGGDGTTAMYGFAKSWRMAQEAIEKATGALAGYQAKAAAVAAAKNEVSIAQAWADAATVLPKTIGGVTSKQHLSFVGGDIGSTTGATNPLSSPTAFKAYLTSLDDAISHTTTTLGKLQTANSQVNTLHEIGSALMGLYESLRKTDPAQAAVVASMLLQINDAGKKSTQTIVEATKANNEFNKSVEDMASSIAGKNATDIGKLLGLDSGTIQSQQTLIDGYRSINDELDKLNQYITQEGGTYANLDQNQKTMVQSVLDQINLQKQLIPVLQQQEQIQDSIAYKATESALTKAGEVQLDETIARLMGNQNNATTREAAYKSAVSGQSLSAMQSLFKDYLTNVVSQWWSQTVKSFTNSMFGDPAAQARNLEATMLKDNRTGLTQILQQTKTDVVAKLFQFEQAFAKDVNKLVGGGSTTPTKQNNDQPPTSDGNWGGVGVEGGWGVGTDGSGGTSSSSAKSRGLGTDRNPIKIATVGDGAQGLFSGPTSQSNMAAAVTQGVDASSTLQKVSENTGNLNDSASGAADTVAAAAAASGSSNSSTNGGGILQGLLGPLGQAIPGLNQYLNSNGSWLNGIANGAAQGFGMGSMIGGAGSTNSDWGALGGALGSGLGTAFGGPIIGQAAGALGGILGGLFGFKPNPINEPDVFDTQNYGQFVANINGSPGTFNGVTISPQSQYSRAAGNEDMSRQMQDWAKKNPNDPLAKQIIALGPQIGIASERQGVFTLGDGQTISVTAYEAIGQAWQSKAKNVNAPLVSVNSYGGGGAASAYSTPGMNSSEFLSQEQAWASGASGQTSGANAPLYGGGGNGGGSGGGGGGGGSSPNFMGGTSSFAVGPGGTNPLATPGYGGPSKSAYGYGAGMNVTSLSLQVSTPVYLDGKMITQIVNAYNAQARSNAGAVGHNPAA